MGSSNAAVTRVPEYDGDVAKEELSQALYIRVTKTDKAALDALLRRVPLKAATLARLALRIGLSEIAKDPSRIFSDPPAPPAPTSKPSLKKKR